MSYQDQIETQQKAVKKLEDENAAKPSDELKAKLVRETDLLRHFENAAKGDPSQRAKRAAELAHKFVTSKIAP
ncbi:MAG: hypothetical protein ABI791_01185 [Acidobacteriota bacterium]